MSQNESPLIILSAGGTGGHVMPAQALSVDLLSRGYRVILMTDARGMKFAHHFGDEVEIIPLKAGTLGAGIMGKIKGLTNLGLGILKAQTLIRRLNPDLVIGFGGYPCVPAVYAAQKAKIPTILHESNAILGKANDYLSKKATRIALSWDNSAGLSEEEWTRAIVTGNPIRPEIAALYTKPYAPLTDKTPLRILIMGGSQGASIFSQIIPAALSELSTEYRARLHIIQQCREEDLQSTKEQYGKADIKAELSTFINDVAAELEACHLFIGRSGASTVTEVSVAGRPAIYVPLGVHKDNQQKINADSVSDAGGAWTFVQEGFTAKALQAKIETFLQDPSILFRTAEKARACAKPDAARKLGNLVTAIVSGWDEEEKNI
ncbi:MAG: undecaprenyldiphospho-muramoylpentapeptide beta-N-acetylglucosaminyltransferase [Alphaproteobacteria bacterium]